MPYRRRSEQGTICSAKVRARPGGADATVPLSRGLPNGSRGRRGTPRQRGQRATPPASPERPAPLPAVLFARRARSDQLEVQGRVVDQPAHHGDPAAVISTAAPRTGPLRERLPAEARHDRVLEHDVRAVARMLEPHSCVTDLVGGDRALIGERSPGQQSAEAQVARLADRRPVEPRGPDTRCWPRRCATARRLRAPARRSRSRSPSYTATGPGCTRPRTLVRPRGPVATPGRRAPGSRSR